ncbi:RNA polymerase sigma factor [Chondromyces apiculatus]|uniref:RNA polymerase sigma factor 70 region 4 type 2 domain-containing protein n=1 Tax=Chondromyces apiculatus DSM 436 TaxID=1192034 RepID=A0A017TH75_9BACT|nr:RNA polymerase sigma factor [Chondromyces apiculatus]EYF08282.1 Hypothetical protein CAP_6043 [Chondromyces apiculatus DSM 436]
MIRARRRADVAHTRPAVYLDEAPILKLRPFVRAVLRAQGVPTRDRDDVCQEIMVAAWTAMTEGRFRPPEAQPIGEALQAWLFGITWRQASHYRQRAWRRREVIVSDPYAMTAAAPWIPHVPAPDGRAAAREMLAALDEIPERMREVLLLRYLEGFDTVEIAEILGIPVPTVSSRLKYGVRRFTTAVQRWRKLRS